jgi:glycosyltransferase involved in cell wall biosynthesis
MDATTNGIPLVMTATGSVRDYVRDGETALAVMPGDVAGVRAAVNRLLSDDALAERLRAAALERAGGWHIGTYLACLGDLVAGRPVRLPPEAP